MMNEMRLGEVAKWAGVSALVVALAGCGGSGSNTTTNTVFSPTGVASLSGNYVYSVVGTSATDGDYYVVGSFVADGMGNITSGVADYNLGSGVDRNVHLTGSYTVSGTSAAIVLTDSIAVLDSFTTTIVPSGTAQIENFDGNGSGTLYPQVTTGFTPAGTYTYTVKGEGQGTVTGSGSFVAGSAGTFTSGTLSYTDSMTMQTYATVTGFLYPPETGGRGQASLQGNNLGYYVIGPNQILMINLDQRALLLLPAQKS
jgi:hypothetical protein